MAVADRVRVALAQMRSPADVERGIAQAVAAIKEAAKQDAELVLLPEAASLIERDAGKRDAQLARLPVEHARQALSEAAREAGAHVLAPMMEPGGPDGRAVNRAHLFGPDGARLASYTKIHLFDVSLPEGESARESASTAPGEAAVVAQTPWGGLGLTICYDLRFPHLFRALAKAGASMIAVPSAFTRPTGRAHWEVLLRARAIETGAFILAPAQGGRHEDGRATWGRSMVVAPWGAVVAALGHADPGIVLADLDLAAVAKARASIPALTHDRAFSEP